MSPPPRLPRPVASLPLLLPLLLLLLCTAAATPLQVPLGCGRMPAPAVRTVDDVAPAFANATESALASADLILHRYSSTLRLIAIPAGSLIAFFGYFLLAPVLFLAAFISGGALCFVASTALLGDATPAAAWVAIAAMLLGGALLGFLALRALNLGMFAVGAALGLVLASALKTSLIATAYPRNPDVAFYVTAAVCGLAFGALAVCLQKQMLIFSTAYAGSCACMFGIGQLAGHFPTAREIESVEKGELHAWVVFYVVLTVALGTVAMFFQFWLARDKPMPTRAPRDRRRRRRSVRHDPDDWSDADDDWADDAYVERIPLPPSKNDYVPRSDLQSDAEGEPRDYKADRMHAPRRSQYTHQSWNDVTHAPSAFEDDDSPLSSDPPFAVMGQGQGEKPTEVGSPVVPSPTREPEPEPVAKKVAKPELLPETIVAVDNTEDVFGVPKTDELADLGAGVYEEGDNKLVSVSLESDIESPHKQ